MLFADLLDLPHDQAGNIDLAVIRALLPGTPVDVATQVYVDHGRKPEFQAAYGHVDISNITWRLAVQPASAIVETNVLTEFRDWYDSVGLRSAAVSARGWSGIDSRKNVIEHWSRHGTWVVPPVLIRGTLLGIAGQHLIEGHTRVGLLCGLIRDQIVDTDSHHEIWLGDRSE